MFEGFTRHRIDVGGIALHARLRRSSGNPEAPALLLLHGHPQTHVIWHKVVAELSPHFTIVASDLRGYGDSEKPAGAADHGNYSKRVMAMDQVALMRSFGYDAFSVMAHDRGARVAHRMAVDHPDKVKRLVTLDIAPTLAMYEQTELQFALAYWHWFFLIRPAPLPETLIEADPQLYMRSTMASRSAGTAPFTEAAWAEYLRCLCSPGAAHGLCEDYRASASIDLDHDRADLAMGRRVECDMLALWGAHGAVGANFDVLAEWRKVARNVTGLSLPCGHYIAEERPDLLIETALPFLLDGTAPG